MYHDGSWGLWFTHGLWGLLFWVIIIALVVFLVGGLAGGFSRRGPRERSRALEILEERYARGEIDQQEFEEKRRQLDS